MPDEPRPPEASQRSGGVIIGNVIGGIHNSIIAGRDVVIKFFISGAEARLALRNRRVMLDKVRAFWVKGVLEQSLHGAVMIDLGLVYKPDAVQYPWDTILQQPDRSPQPIERGTKMIDVFDQVGGELLILGAPGSGKTTLLLDLARDLIARAEDDETLPIPVVFNLSAWAEKRPPLAEWLVDELYYRYDVPRKIGKAWVEQGQLLPLLDGLDEVKTEHRTGCVEAINCFRQEHGLVRLVTCSRSAEYEALRIQIRLQSAVVLQPLTRDQVDAYLQSAGEPLAAVRTLLQRDSTLQELTESPLMFSVLVLAYRDADATSLLALGSTEQRRAHLFDTYIQRMFERRGADSRYAPQQVIHWLAWLARQLVEHTQTTFFLERMQPDWLSNKQRQQYMSYFMLTGGLIFGSVIGGGIPVGLIAVRGMFQLSVVPVILLLFVGFMAGVLGVWNSENEETKIVEALHWSWSMAIGSLGVPIVLMLVGGLAMGVILGLIVGLVMGFAVGLHVGKAVVTNGASLTKP